MKFYFLHIFPLFFVSCEQTAPVFKKQTLYEVGSSVVSIEPTGETVSLALAGYSSPPLGRFTITWDDKGALEAIAMCSVDEAIYIASTGGDIFLVDTEELQKNKKAGSLQHVKFLAGDHRKIYAVTKDNFLLQRSVRKQGEEWQRIGYNNGDTYTTTPLPKISGKRCQNAGIFPGHPS